MSYYGTKKSALSCRLRKGKNNAHFLTERFDRNGDIKLHIQTLAAMHPVSSCYEDLFDVALRIGVLPEGLQHLFKQMVMNVLAGNIDDHNKNFSFIMGVDGKWSCAPAYDFTFSVDTDAPGYLNRHCMSINGNVQDITLDDIMSIARRFNIKWASVIIDTARNAVTNYHTYAAAAGVDSQWIAKIARETSARMEIMDS